MPRSGSLRKEIEMSEKRRKLEFCFDEHSLEDCSKVPHRKIEVTNKKTGEKRMLILPDIEANERRLTCTTN